MHADAPGCPSKQAGTRAPHRGPNYLAPRAHARISCAASSFAACSTLQCPRGCGTCISRSRCKGSGCLRGYIYDGQGGCAPCGVSNCSVCRTKDTCHRCKDGFALVNGTCAAVSAAAGGTKAARPLLEYEVPACGCEYGMHWSALSEHVASAQTDSSVPMCPPTLPLATHRSASWPTAWRVIMGPPHVGSASRAGESLVVAGASSAPGPPANPTAQLAAWSPPPSARAA